MIISRETKRRKDSSERLLPDIYDRSDWEELERLHPVFFRVVTVQNTPVKDRCIIDKIFGLNKESVKVRTKDYLIWTRNVTGAKIDLEEASQAIGEVTVYLANLSCFDEANQSLQLFGLDSPKVSLEEILKADMIIDHSVEIDDMLCRFRLSDGVWFDRLKYKNFVLTTTEKLNYTYNPLFFPNTRVVWEEKKSFSLKDLWSSNENS